MRQQCDRTWFRAEALDEGLLREGREERRVAGTSGTGGEQDTLSHTLISYWWPPITHPHQKQESGV